MTNNVLVPSKIVRGLVAGLCPATSKYHHLRSSPCSARGHFGESSRITEVKSCGSIWTLMCPRAEHGGERSVSQLEWARAGARGRQTGRILRCLAERVDRGPCRIGQEPVVGAIGDESDALLD